MSRNGQKLTTLRNLLGESLFDDVTQVFAGDVIAFPKNHDWIDKDERNRCIKLEYNDGQGVPIQELAEKYSLSQSHTYKIIEKTL